MDINRTWYLLEIGFACENSDCYADPRPEIELKFNKALGTYCHSSGYGPTHRNATYYFGNLPRAVEALKKATKLAKRLNRAGEVISVNLGVTTR